MRLELVTAVDPYIAFASVADFANLDLWDPFVRKSQLVVGEPMTIGAVYRLESPSGLTLHYRVMEIERPNHVVYQGGTDRVTSTDTIEVTRIESGTRVTVTSDLEFTGRMKPLAPIIRALVWAGGRLGSFPALRRHLATIN